MLKLLGFVDFVLFMIGTNLITAVVSSTIHCGENADDAIKDQPSAHWLEALAAARARRDKALIDERLKVERAQLHT
jgi:hypothetical protein